MVIQSIILPLRLSKNHREDERNVMYPDICSEGSPNERNLGCSSSSRLHSDYAKPDHNKHDVDGKDITDVEAVKGATIAPSVTPRDRYRLEDCFFVHGESENMVPATGLGVSSSLNCSHEHKKGYTVAKGAVEYQFDNMQSKYRKQNSSAKVNPISIDSIDGGQCVSTFYTVVAMGSMLIALFVPALFHVCCQFRLYGVIVNLREGITELNDPQSYTWLIVERMREFENFFIFGVLLYLTIQAIGFFATHSRINRYLWRLCCISVENSKHDFLYVSKQCAIERFSEYTKQLSNEHSKACTQTEQNLVKAFDDASLKFDSDQVDDVWSQTMFSRYRMMFSRIYLPFLINAVISVGTAALVYDRRFRMHHRVPLAHPDIVANLYWYAAIQYEGFWCILVIFLLNMVTWLYLCHTNRHKTLFGFLGEAADLFQKVTLDHAENIAKNIWDDQMLLFSSTMYAMKSNRVSRNCTYTPITMETFNSQIQFNNRGLENKKRPCLCHCLCTPTIEEVKSNPLSLLGPSPLEELYSPLLESESHEGFRKVGRII